MPSIRNPERVAFSPGEFAALFGKQQTWGYRQIYAGKVKAITEYGRIQIPAAEVERILGSATRYNGLPKKTRTKDDFQALVPELQSAWQDFIRKKRQGTVASTKKATVPFPLSSTSPDDARKSVLRRIAGKTADSLRKKRKE